MAARKPGVDTEPAGAAARARDRQRDHPHAAEGLRLHRRRPALHHAAHGHRRPGACGLNGDRYAAGLSFRPAAAAVPLLQAVVRPGHQPAHRPDPRRDGDVAHHLYRQGAEHSRRDAGALPHAAPRAPHPYQSRSGKAAPRLAGRFSGHHAARAVSRGRWRKGAGAGSRRPLPPRLAGHQIRLHAADHFRSRRGQRLRAHPQPAIAGGSAQSPRARGEPHASGAGCGIRRAARGDALLASHGLWRERHQSVPGYRDAGRSFEARLFPGERPARQGAQELHQVRQ